MRGSIPAERLPDLPPGAAPLADEAVTGARARWGANDIIEVPAGRVRELVLDTIKDPMIWFLVATGVLYAILGQRAEAVTLLVSVVPLAGMGAFLHRRTQASIAGLAGGLAAHARVMRGGGEREVPAAEVVVGDLVAVRAGESFPADGVLVEAHELQVDESALTGEAYPVRKVTAAGGEPSDTTARDASWGLAGTRVLTGRGVTRIVYTGRETLYGEIVQSAVAGRHQRTPLQAGIANIVGVLLVVALLLCLILGAVRLLQGHGWIDALMSAATLAVAALPEEFPVVFTMFLGVGVVRLARRHALVRRAVSVENIGRITCIASDKTGTLTVGLLQVAHLVPVAGVDETRLLGAAAAASRAESGDPLDVAILEEAGRRTALPGGTVLATFPFTEDRRRETTAVAEAHGVWTATKGAPETILSMCAPATPRASWEERANTLAADGHKVLAVAQRRLPGNWGGGEPTADYELLGLIACEDPLRPDVAESVRACRDAGIRVVMVTGDHPATAQAMAREAGIGSRVLSGAELSQMLGEGRSAALGDVDIVARAQPAQKLALVRALQAQGEIVAVTGDGVNDVPALQAADVGITMGQRGTRSAREVASIVLLDDDFSTIVRAIFEGRQLFRNLQASFAYLLMVHVPLVITAALIPLAGYPLLYAPIHVVWIEAIIHPTAILSFQSLPDGATRHARPPARAGRFFELRDWLVLVLAGGLVTAGLVATYLAQLGPAGSHVGHARAMAMAVLVTFSSSLALLLGRLRTRAAVWIPLGSLAVSIALIQIGPLAAWLGLVPLHPWDWGAAALIAVSAVAVPALAVTSRGRRRRRSVRPLK